MEGGSTAARSVVGLKMGNNTCLLHRLENLRAHLVV